VKSFLSSTEAFLENHNGDRNIEVLDAYLNTVFIYAISAYIIHKKDFGRDTNARKQVSILKQRILEIYKELLISGNGDKYDLLRSVYARILNDKKYDLRLLGSLIKHDNRHDDAIGFIAQLRDKALEEEYSHGGRKYSYTLPGNYAHSVEARLYYAQKLCIILDKIENIENIIDELCAAGAVDEADVEFEASVLESPFALFKLTHDKKPDA
jgi:hypothetical protein